MPAPHFQDRLGAINRSPRGLSPTDRSQRCPANRCHSAVRRLQERPLQHPAPLVYHMPPGCRPPDIPFADLERSFTGNLRPAARCRQTWSLDQLQSFFMGGPQPELMLVLLATVMEIAGDGPEETRPRAGIAGGHSGSVACGRGATGPGAAPPLNPCRGAPDHGRIVVAHRPISRLNRWRLDAGETRMVQCRGCNGSAA